MSARLVLLLAAVVEECTVSTSIVSKGVKNTDQEPSPSFSTMDLIARYNKSVIYISEY